MGNWCVLLEMPLQDDYHGTCPFRVREGTDNARDVCSARYRVAFSNWLPSRCIGVHLPQGQVGEERQDRHCNTSGEDQAEDSS